MQKSPKRLNDYYSTQDNEERNTETIKNCQEKRQLKSKLCTFLKENVQVDILLYFREVKSYLPNNYPITKMEYYDEA
jgi:hypothetical protein